MLKPMIKALRAAQGRPGGAAILDILREEPVKQSLLTAAASGLPPISVVSDVLDQRFPGLLASSSARQFVGICIAGLMAEEGYEVAPSRARLHGAGPFKTGACYRPAHERATDRDDAVERMIAAEIKEELEDKIKDLETDLREEYEVEIKAAIQQKLAVEIQEALAEEFEERMREALASI
jgi:hypothetical protein